MLGIIKEEMNRAMKSKGMLLALTIGITIVMIHIIHYIISFHYANQMIDFEKYPIIYPATVCDKWIEGNTFTMESFLYFLLLPIIAVLPFGTSYLTDNQSGFLKGIYMRISRKKYLIAKYISSFVAGGIAVILPLSVNLMCALIFLPNLDPQVVSGQSLIRAATVFHELYYSNPLIYLVLFLGLDFIMGGVFACIALACSYISDFKVIVAICPFFLQLVIHVIMSMFMKFEYSSVYFLQSGYGISALWIVLLYIVIGMGFSAAVFLKKGEKEDIF